MTPIAAEYLQQALAAKKKQLAQKLPSATVENCARYFGVSQSTIYRWLRIGNLTLDRSALRRTAIIDEKFHSLAAGLMDYHQWLEQQNNPANETPLEAKEASEPIQRENARLQQENKALREQCEATRHLCQQYIAKISQLTDRLHQLQKQQTVVIIEPPMPITYRGEVRCNQR